MIKIHSQQDRGNIFATVIGTSFGYFEIDEIYSKTGLKEIVLLVPRKKFIVKRY